MRTALRKWVLVALSLFNLLASVALLCSSSSSCPRGLMSQLGINARDFVYVLRHVVGARNLRLAFARLVDNVSALDLSIAHVLVFFGGILLVAALCNLSISSGGREQQQPDNQITFHLTSNTKSKSARCTLLYSFDEHDPVRRGRVELHRGDATDMLTFSYQHQERAL